MDLSTSSESRAMASNLAEDKRAFYRTVCQKDLKIMFLVQQSIIPFYFINITLQ